MNRLPKISIITPSYNQGEFLQQTIESVLGQNYPNLEYWVIDGGSTDATLDVLRSYGEAVQWVSEPDNGQTDALNKGFKKVSGDIVGFINSDDVLTPNVLWEIAAEFMQNPELVWITGEYEIIDTHGVARDPLVRWYKRVQRDLLMFFPGLFGTVLGVNNPIIQPSTFWKRSVHEAVGFLREDLDLVMDYEWWWRIYQEFGAPKVVPYVWSLFRVHEDSKGGKFFAARLDEQKDVAQEYGVNAMLLFFHNVHNQVISWMYTRGIS